MRSGEKKKEKIPNMLSVIWSFWTFTKVFNSPKPTNMWRTWTVRDTSFKNATIWVICKVIFCDVKNKQQKKWAGQDEYSASEWESAFPESTLFSCWVILTLRNDSVWEIPPFTHSSTDWCYSRRSVYRHPLVKSGTVQIDFGCHPLTQTWTRKERFTMTAVMFRQLKRCD